MMVGIENMAESLDMSADPVRIGSNASQIPELNSRCTDLWGTGIAFQKISLATAM